MGYERCGLLRPYPVRARRPKVELKMKSQLFYTAHQLVEAGPRQAVSWFAVGCYYHLLGKNELAQRYFLKVSRFSRPRIRGSGFRPGPGDTMRNPPPPPLGAI